MADRVDEAARRRSVPGQRLDAGKRMGTLGSGDLLALVTSILVRMSDIARPPRSAVGDRDQALQALQRGA